jgi:hypothetical protein
MNFNKGARTRGRGKSFKGALTYYLHDKGMLDRAERVGFVELLNLSTDDPHHAWREMMATAEAGPELKRRAGLKSGGRKNEQPVYAFSLEWHPDDKPDAAHMRHYAREALKLLGLQDHQAVIVQHTDTPHAHVHITVNLIHPETGKSAGIYNDEKRLDRWCHDYEIRMGVIRSPERAAKYQALDDGRKPERKPRAPKRFQPPDLKPANDDQTARERAQALKEGIAAYQAGLKATQQQAWKRRKAEERKLWNDYRTARQAIRARHQFEMDKIYKHKRNRDALPLSIQGFRDWKETREWKALMARLKAENRRFEYRERTLFGFLSNTIGLLRPGMQRTGKGLMPMLFTLLVSGKARREIMLARQRLATRALSDKQFGSRRARADKIRLVREAQMAVLSRAYDIQKQELDRRHAQEIDKQKLDWKALSIERKRLWDEWRAAFDIPARRRSTQGSSDSGDSRARSPAPRPKDHFPDVGKKVPDKMVKTPKPKPSDSRAKASFEQEAQPAMPQSKAGWKQRRSAAERKADGSYKPRQRKGPAL